MSSTPRPNLTGRAFQRTAILQPRLDTTVEEEFDQQESRLNIEAYSTPEATRIGRSGLTNYLKCCCCPLMAVLFCDGCKDKFCRSCGPRLHQSIVALRGHPPLRILPRAEDEEVPSQQARRGEQQLPAPIHQMETSRSSRQPTPAVSPIMGKQPMPRATPGAPPPAPFLSSTATTPRGRRTPSKLVRVVKDRVKADALVRETRGGGGGGGGGTNQSLHRSAMSPKQARQADLLYKRVHYEALERSLSPTQVYPRRTPSRGGRKSSQRSQQTESTYNRRWESQQSAAIRTFMEEEQWEDEDGNPSQHHQRERTGSRRPDSPSVSFHSVSATPSRSFVGSGISHPTRQAPQLIPVQDSMNRPRAVTTPIRRAAKQVLATRVEENNTTTQPKKGKNVDSSSVTLNSTTNAHQLPLTSLPFDTEEGEAALSNDIFYTVAAHSSFGSSPTKGGPSRRPIGHGLGVHSYISPSMRIYRNLPDFVPELTEGRREVDGWWKLNK